MPRSIQVDNGTEFTANEFDAWAYAHKIDVHFITPGRPVENAVIESFNGKLRDECLNANWFESLEDARPQLEHWRTDYNETRPHSSLGGIPPAQYVANLIEWAPLARRREDRLEFPTGPRELRPLNRLVAADCNPTGGEHLRTWCARLIRVVHIANRKQSAGFFCG